MSASRIDPSEHPRSRQQDPLLLTPGPLTTSATVKQAMLRDMSTWDRDYNAIVQSVRRSLCELANEPGSSGDAEEAGPVDCTAVLMQGSGTFAVEATLGTAVPRDGRLLIVRNGAYGDRMVAIAERIGLDFADLAFDEVEPVDPERVEQALHADPAITHLAMVHCETTTGMLNPAAAVGSACRARGVRYLLDAMSSFGGVPMSLQSTGADFLVSSANKCVQGVPGFGFVVARRDELARCAGQARSLSLDLFEQWRGMEDGGGKWRYTSPTHVLLAFAQALTELAAEGGVPARHERYHANQRQLVAGFRELGFRTLLDDRLQSPIITAFRDPVASGYRWQDFYEALKARGFALYPGKVSRAATFRVGTIGEVFPADVDRLLEAVTAVVAEFGWQIAD